METFAVLERVTLQWLVQRYQRRALRRAVHQTYSIFAAQHPNWVAALFDEHFVNTHLLPMLQSAAKTGETITARQVADQWARQISLLPSLRQKHSAAILPVATHFLCLLAAELAAAQVKSQTPMLVETAAG